ncbi:MAG: META domain-containing protein [Fibrobacter sp.]|jgi:heat shock protein HslJ|nr:META domain-containing protein [Fibrobacter sp.]
MKRLLILTIVFFFSFSLSKEENLSLSGTRWCLARLENQTPDCTHFTEQSPHLVLDSAGAAFGSSGCNRFRGTFRLSEKERISFGTFAVTRKMCADMSIENRFFKLLDSVKTYRFAGADSLRFLDASGNLLMQWKAVRE